MPYTISDDQGGLGVLITLIGDVRGDDVFTLNAELMADERFAQWQYLIWDLSNIGRFEPTCDELRGYAMQEKMAARINPDLLPTIIPPKFGNGHLMTIFRILEQVWGSYESKYFTNPSAARDWVMSKSKVTR